MSPLLLSLALNLIQACPSYTTCAFSPVTGSNPNTMEWNELFAAASSNELAAASPSYPNIEVGLNRVPQSPRIACHILQPIAATESRWLQFCPDSNKTVISFDCGFGVMQVTSGAAAYGPALAADTTWNVGAGTKILIGKWNSEFRGGPIGESDPMVLENWYYAVWAYNGFVYGNNPDNPQHPANRPPFNGPNSLSRGNYPYQEIVWGYLHYPLDWRTTPKYQAIAVTYPAPGQVGSDPGPLPRLQPEHRSECKQPCEDDDCDFELIIDDNDQAFSLLGSASVANMGGYKDQFYYASNQSSPVRAGWTLIVPKTAVYRVSMYVPAADFITAINAPVTMMVRGATLSVDFDQSRPGRLFYALGEVKLLKDQVYEVVATNLSPGENQDIAFDAVRIVYERPVGMAVVSDPCAEAIDCSADLVCVDSLCRPGCMLSDCPGSSCNLITGLCLPTSPKLDAGIIDVGMAQVPPPPSADAGTASTIAPDAMEDEDCSCSTLRPLGEKSLPTWLWIALAVGVISALRRVRPRPFRRRYTS